MNRFSPKQTLSNFTTAVRETVDFVSKKSFALGLLSILFLGIQVHGKDASEAASAVAQPPQPMTRPYTPEELQRIRNDEYTDKDTRKKTLRDRVKEKCDAAKAAPTDQSKRVDCEEAKSDLADLSPNTSRLEAYCDRQIAEIKTLSDKATKSCSAAGYGNSLGMCYGMIAECNANDPELGTDDDVDASRFCDAAFANTCSGLPMFNIGRDYRSEKLDAERDRKEAKRDLDDLMSDKRQQMNEQIAKQREMLENQQNEELNARKAERAVAEKMKAELEGVSATQKKAFESAQEAYNQMEVEYIKMRKEARDATDLVNQAQDDLQVMCRASAEKKYQEAEKARVATLAARKKNIGASTNVSGSSKRTKAAIARARLIDYTAYFNECTSGSSPDGVGGNNRIKTAERARASAEKLLVEKAGMIEKQRSQMLEKLKAMEADATNQQSKIVQDMNQKIEDMNEERTLIAQQNQQRIADANRSSLEASNALQSRIDTANAELMRTQKEADTADARISCLGKNAQRSESRRDKAEEGFSSGYSDVLDLANECERYSAKSCADRPVICDTAIRAKNGQDAKGKKIQLRPVKQ